MTSEEVLALTDEQIDEMKLGPLLSLRSQLLQTDLQDPTQQALWVTLRGKVTTMFATKYPGIAPDGTPLPPIERPELTPPPLPTPPK